ncbi:DNA polymerase III subunit alpha [Litchfieldia salsa]|uniref:DNA polymerase III subunit alpha n=1 Tax=Litchfieldia salsa TaxID=930152 RepID=A0A1H0P3V9_9BACI|nr:DNA polymerase III subunit alpha [Litchfieldia salsa]SDO99360.1 DNA polymerase III catalytic subunit, DnaE type [Litchfieldia salsa]
MSFIHLQVNSGYSLLSSSVGVEELVKRAKEFGYKALALTDNNVMYGAVHFYKECRKNGIKPIIGLTVSILTNDEDDQSSPLILLAKNQQGYRNLLKISSIVQTKSKAGLPKKWLKHYSTGLIGITPGMDGEIEQLLLNNQLEDAILSITFYKECFEIGDFYLGYQRLGLNEEAELHKQLKILSHGQKIPVVATNHVQYLNKDDKLAFECLVNIRNGTKLSENDRFQLESSESYFKTIHEMVDLFSDSPELLEQTMNIASKCHVEIELGKMALPKYPVPEGEPANEFLARVCLKGLKERYPEPKEEHYDRLTYELSVITKMNFSDYFLIVWDFMEYAHQQGILTGPGRGSAAGSIVAYVLKITDVDPIKHSLLFERFLNPERISMPDIDIDFPDNRRDELIAYVANKYGQLHVAQIITFGTLSARAVLRDVGRVMGISVKEADFIAKQVPSKLGITLQQALKESKGLQEYLQKSEVGKRIFDTSLRLEGLPRHTSTHAAGVVISEKPLTDLIPIQEGHQEVYLTQFSMEILEELGLLKMDFLGLRNLTLIDQILTLIRKNTSKTIDLATIPTDDSNTFSLLSTGDTTGIFQLESSGMRNVLERLRPTELEDIVAVNALYRPGPMENIPVYIDRKHKKEDVIYPHPDLEPILKQTYGVIVYQEQIMQIASMMAGFSLGEADLLRRAVSKKKKEVLDQERVHFVQGCINRGYDRAVADSIYDLIVRFANYGFNRSHAVAYSMIAYQLAYLKANYRTYFTAALLTSAVGNDEKLAQYIREAKQKGINILSPSINKSTYPFLVEKSGIRFSLSAVKGVGVAALRDILAERKKKPFRDLFDFCIRVSMRHVNRRILEALICSGAFDEFKEDRATLLATVDVAIEHAELVHPKDKNQIDLFVDDDDFMIKPKYVNIEPFTQEEKLQFEKEALGFYLSNHPVSTLLNKVNQHVITQIADIVTKESSNLKKTVCVLITTERTIRTKKGEVMAFLTLSDETGDMDAVAFPAVYTRFSKNLKKGEIQFLEGNVEKRDNRTQFIIKSVKTIEEVEPIKENDSNNKLFLKIESNHQQEDLLEDLKSILKKNHGTVAVIVYFEKDQKTIALQREYWVSIEEKTIQQFKNLLGDKNVVVK